MKNYDVSVDYATHPKKLLHAVLSANHLQHILALCEPSITLGQVTERGECALMKAAANGHWEPKRISVRHFWVGNGASFHPAR